MEPAATPYDQNAAPPTKNSAKTNNVGISIRLMERLDDDISISAPRSGDAGGRAVSDWIARHKERFVGILADLLVESSGNGTAEAQAERLNNARDVAEKVLSQVLPELRAFALGRIALRWGAGKYPNFVVIGRPQYRADENQWRVPLEYARIQKHIGEIVLDDEGNVLAEATTTRQQAREGWRGQ